MGVKDHAKHTVNPRSWHSDGVLICLNLIFLGGGIAIAVLSKKGAAKAKNELEVKFEDLSVYFDDWDMYLNTFETVYGLCVMIYGIIIAVGACCGAVAFWYRFKFLVILYMIFIVLIILINYAIGAVLLIYSKKDSFPFYSATIEGEITDGLSNGYCDDTDIGVDSNAINPIIDLFRTGNGTVVSSQANEIFSDCPVYYPGTGQDCDEATQDCTTAIVVWLLERMGRVGIIMVVIASLFVVVCAVAIWFLMHHHLWIPRQRSRDLHTVLGDDTLARYVTVEAMRNHKGRASWDGLSPISTMKKGLPPSILQDLEDVEDTSPHTYVAAVEDTLSAYQCKNSISGTSFAWTSRTRNNSKIAKNMTVGFERETSRMSDMESRVSDATSAAAAFGSRRAKLKRGTSNASSGGRGSQTSYPSLAPPAYARSQPTSVVPSKPPSESRSRVSFQDSVNKDNTYYSGAGSSATGPVGQKVPVSALAGWWAGEKIGRLAKHPGVDDPSSDSDLDINEEDWLVAEPPNKDDTFQDANSRKDMGEDSGEI